MQIFHVNPKFSEITDNDLENLDYAFQDLEEDEGNEFCLISDLIGGNVGYDHEVSHKEVQKEIDDRIKAAEEVAAETAELIQTLKTTAAKLAKLRREKGASFSEYISLGEGHPLEWHDEWGWNNSNCY